MKKHLFLIVTMLIAIVTFAQPTSSPNGYYRVYEANRIYFKIGKSSRVQISYPTIKDSAGKIAAAFSTYSVTNCEEPFVALDTNKLKKVYRVTFSDTTNINGFISTLSGLGFVVYAEKIPAMFTTSVPNDPNQPYYLALVNQNAASSIHIATGNAVVAIVDDAILTTHEDLAANVGTVNRDVADLDNNPDPPLSGSNATNGSNFAHGTHVAGIAGGVTNNNKGIASIGWNNKLMCIKARQNSNMTQGAITHGYDGITWAATNGAHVINMSWGGTAYSQTEYNVVAAAKALNVVLVAAAGNYSTPNGFYPAAYGEGMTGQTWEVKDRNCVVAVASLDANNDISNFGSGYWTPALGSNYGPWVDISAYGSSILSTIANSSGGLAINNQYTTLSGTSMASPIVAGIAGVMKSYDMSKSADAIINCLRYTANPDIYNIYTHPNNYTGMLGSGRVDAAAALRCLSPSCTNPIAVITPSSYYLCPASTITLTANSASSYSWSNGATTQSTTVNAPGIYTLSIVLPGPCTATQTINIQNADLQAHILMLEASGLAPNDGVLCGQDMLQLTSYSGLTYSWSAFGATTPQCGGVINAGSSVPFTWTVSVTIGGVGGCVGSNSTASTTVQWLKPPTLTVTPTSTTMVNGCPATLTVTGASTYSWVPSGTVICPTCASPLFSPTATTIYTVTGTDAYGCVDTETASISVTTNTYCAGTQPTTYTISSSGTFNPSTGFLTQNLYVNTGANYTISCPDLRIEPNVNIYVANGATLNINGSWLHACGTCSGSMWQGIVAQPGAVIQVNNYSIIEDAVKAIYSPVSYTASPVTTWQINAAIFNKNGADIYAEQTYADMSASYVYNSVHTCRNLISHTIGSANFSSLKSSIAAATPSSPGTNTPTVTLAGTRTTYGMYLNGIQSGTIYVGNSAQSNNVFDNMDYGVFSGLTGLVVKNNNFQNLTGSNGIGVGVTANGNSWEMGARPLVVGNDNCTVVAGEKNYFTNCLYGVQALGLQQVAINNNSFTNETTSATFTSGNQIGQYAVINTGYAVHSNTATTTENLTFCNNYVSNYATGYYLDFGKLYNTSDANQSFSTNTITAVGTSTAYCNQGLYLQQSNTFGAGSGVPWDAVSVTSNSITNVAVNAIALSAIGNSTVTPGFVNVYSNPELSIKYNSSATSSVSPHIAAVYVSGCYRISINNNTKIQCTGLSGYPSSNAQYIAGVYIAASPSSSVNCNTVKYVGEGFVWEGSSAGSKWQKNNVQNSRYGLVLRNSGIMGDQGASGSPVGDIFGKFVSTNITDAHTLADHSDPGLSGFSSKLYNLTGSCTAATTYSPCQNNQNAGTAYAAGTTIFTTTGSLPCVCIGDCGTARVSNEGSQEDNLVLDEAVGLREIIRGIDNNVSLPVFDFETKWASQYYASSQDMSLVSAAGFNNAKTFAIIDAALNSGDYTTARSMLTAVSPGNMIEENWLKVDRILARPHSDTLSLADVRDLKAVSAQCPLEGGSVVYKARTMLNSYYRTIFTYQDLCNSEKNKASNAATRNQADDQLVNVYPNPNNGNMTFVYNIRKDAVLEIMDVRGVVVEKYLLPATENQLQISAGRLTEGVYLYRVSNDAGSASKTGRLIIIR